MRFVHIWQLAALTAFTLGKPSAFDRTDPTGKPPHEVRQDFRRRSEIAAWTKRMQAET